MRIVKIHDWFTTGSFVLLDLSQDGKGPCRTLRARRSRGQFRVVTLTRRVNESVLINEDIRVTVVHLKNQRVRLQIDAPSNVSVRRERLELDEPEPAERIAAGS